MSWSKEEIEILIESYQDCQTNELRKLLPNKNIYTVYRMARKLGLKRKKQGNSGYLNKLLDDKPISYYWIGFLLADGTFTKNLFKVTTNKDFDHLDKLSVFIKSHKPYFGNRTKNSFAGIGKEYILACSDKEHLSKIIQKFDIKSNKTYNPPDIKVFKNLFTTDLFKAFLIGFIDGDGSIDAQKTKCSIKIELHSSWLPILNIIYDFISTNYNSYISKPKINKRGYAEYRIGRIVIIKDLLEFIIKNDLPVLERKWNKVQIYR